MWLPTEAQSEVDSTCEDSNCASINVTPACRYEVSFANFVRSTFLRSTKEKEKIQHPELCFDVTSFLFVFKKCNSIQPLSCSR